MASPKLKLGAKGKLVGQLQKFLNLKGRLPKPIPENEEFGPETKEAVRYFQKKAKLKVELDGVVGPETARALAKAVGPSAAAFAKAFGEVEETVAKPGADQGAADKEDASADAPAQAAGTPGKGGSVLHTAGKYRLSIPPNPTGTFPLVVLFGGITHIPPVLKATPEGLFKNAILVFSESDGSYSAALKLLKPLLEQKQIKIGPVSICGYSLGGQAAFREYGNATKKVGLIDPTTYERNLAKLDGKAIFSCNPDGWTEPKYASIVAAQKAAEKRINGGYYERKSVGHGAYPQYFLEKFGGQLI